MQCPETPQSNAHQNFAFSSGRTPDTATLRKRTFSIPYSGARTVSSRFLGRDDTTHGLHSSRWSTEQDTTPSASFTTTKVPSFLRKRPYQADDVFDSKSKSSVAVSQFHDAARRLALSPLSHNVQSQPIQEDGAFDSPARCHNIRPQIITHSYHFSESKNASCQAVIERDITSARRGSLYSQYHQFGSSPTPRLVPKLSAYRASKSYSPRRTEIARQGNTPISRNFSRPTPKRQLASGPLRTHNFSRPIRMPQSRKNSGRNISAQQRTNTGTPEVPTLPHETERRDFGVPNGVYSISAGETREEAQAEPVLQRAEAAPVQINHLAAERSSTHDSVRESFDSAVSDCLGDKRLQLASWEIWAQRIFVSLLIFTANIALGLTYLGSFKHPYLLPILVFMKSKDILSTIADILGILHTMIRHWIWPPKTPDPRWILSLVCAYAETEEQIMKTVYSLARGKTQPHKQAICIILDGKPRDVLGKMSSVEVTVRRPYTTWRGVRGEIVVNAGYIEGIPLILVTKAKNAGKKDSLILGHDLFNFPRKDMPHSTQMLRKEVWETVLPAVMKSSKRKLEKFDFVFCTDADSTIHDFALRRLADALCREDNAIAGCGVLFAEFGDKKQEWSPWHLFQQFQYTFGQYVRRQAESTWGRVTCLPGCITMIVVRPEMGRALSEYAKPVTGHNLYRHQVQYLGTDRRLTWCMMSQGKHLRTVFVPDALSETVVPNEASHYLSQRRRWASNAYFNDFFYLFGQRQRLVTRLFALIDIVRLSLVYYRIFNTGYFLYGLITNFYVIKVIPTLIITKTPATWYLLLVVIREPFLRKRLHKIVLGMCINQVISPILSVIVFTNVLFHLGSQAWGKTGASTQGSAATTVAEPATVSPSHDMSPSQKWTPKRLARSVRLAIRGITPKRSPIQNQTPAISSSSPVPLPQHHTPKIDAIRRPSSTPSQDAALRSHPPESSESIETPIASSTTLDLQRVDNQTPALAVYTPSHRLRKQSFSTPMTLSKRTPYRQRQRAPSRLASYTKETRVRDADDSADALAYDDG